jgi:hypothetical protein
MAVSDAMSGLEEVAEVYGISRCSWLIMSPDLSRVNDEIET